MKDLNMVFILTQFDHITREIVDIIGVYKTWEAVEKARAMYLTPGSKFDIEDFPILRREVKA